MTPNTIQKLVAGSFFLAFLHSSLAATPVTPYQDRLSSEMAPATTGALSSERTEYAYGRESLQKLDFWHAKTTKPAPLILFVHGGGWMHGDKRNATGLEKVGHFTNDGYAFASINYRLVPDATVEQQAADVAAAFAWIRSNAATLGVDASRIVLMGHSAGAHLVTLVGTDPQYLNRAGLSLEDIQGIIALDGACYDVPRQIREGGRFMQDTYVQTFGTDPVRQRALSPTWQAAAPNAPRLLIAHINRADGKNQSEALARALVQAGTTVEVHGFDDTGLRGHMAINRSLGNADYPVTAVVDAWLRKLPRSN